MSEALAVTPLDYRSEFQAPVANLPHWLEEVAGAFARAFSATPDELVGYGAAVLLALDHCMPKATADAGGPPYGEGAGAGAACAETLAPLLRGGFVVLRPQRQRTALDPRYRPW